MTLVDRVAPHIHWGLRLSLAATFLYHAASKFPVAEFAAAAALPIVTAWLITIAGIAAGICLIVGAFGNRGLTRLSGGIIVIIMFGAIVLIHWENGFSYANNGFEFQLLALVTGLYFMVRGNDV